MNASLLEHLKELRQRLVICVLSILVLGIFSYTYYHYFYTLFSQPFKSIASVDAQHFYVKSVLEGVITKLKFATLFGVILSLPLFIFHLLRFVMPGLKKNENKFLIVSIITSFILSAVSFFYGYFILLPLSLKFLMSNHFIPSDVGILLTYSENIFFVFNLLAYLIVVFQLPIIIVTLLHLNIFSRKSLLKSSRYMIVCIMILSAILTPPDVISQVLLSLPLIILFFSAILFAKCFRIGNHV
ncbi:twin-arginine translocase subunit TatC [Candidatus Marinamargulisbacteria bacterium SCGC AG-343-D04]|nr:twin-arginine translocase subunit TatC [Candidatus Marinamargulisbacteria bacterium SCGC AG-343-D04]